MNVLKPFIDNGKRLVRFTTKHSNWILALLAVIGTAGVAEEFTRATIKAVKLCEQKKPKGFKEIIKTVWKLYIPGVGFIIVVITSVCGNAHLNAKKLATVTSLWAASKADVELIKAKAKEMLGEGKAKKIEDEVERAKVNNNPPPKEDHIVKTGHGDQLFMFGWTGQYFRASPEYIELIFHKLDDELQSEPDNEIYMHRLIEMLDMPQCDAGNAYWSLYEMLQHGYKRIEADITSCHWMDVNGKQEMVSTLRCIPAPNFL